MINVYADLRRGGIRPTASRVAVLALFHAQPAEHFTAEQVFQKLLRDDAGSSLPSVYRALSQLAKSGLILSSSIGETRIVHELNNKGAHHHLVCDVCGCVIDIVDRRLNERFMSLAADREFAFASSSLVIHGKCAACGLRDTQRARARIAR